MLLRNAFKINFAKRLINPQSIMYKGFSNKSFPTKSDYFDTSPLEDLAVNEIEGSCALRKTKGSINLAQKLLDKLRSSATEQEKNDISVKLRIELRKIPNKTHPTVSAYGDVQEPVEIASFGQKNELKVSAEISKYRQEASHLRANNNVFDFGTMCTGLNILRTEQMGNFTGPRSYYLMYDAAELEQALIRYTTDILINNGFELISVPDILPAEVIEACGMPTVSEKNQIYRINPTNRCLSGTSEMALAGYLSGKTFKKSDLPKKLVAVSRCFRAEVSGLKEEKGIFRVHNFTKVEMFSVCTPDQSEAILEDFKDIQCRIFDSIGLHFKVLDMPISDLGAPAYRKYDIEAWMAGRHMYGEISSSSNCTDFQSKRLNIYVDDGESKGVHAHTVNGTACAVPRMLIAIMEHNQQQDGTINIPEVLQKYMDGRTKIVKRKSLPAQQLVKRIQK